MAPKACEAARKSAKHAAGTADRSKDTLHAEGAAAIGVVMNKLTLMSDPVYRETEFRSFVTFLNILQKAEISTGALCIP